ncbi:MAG: DUF2461 domain-containing protein [Myxococcales bacterium]|nr:DUF2461 domain-containing protein [Myxococcales bacterium]
MPTRPRPIFTEELWRFLAELSAHNDREWFNANKKRYEKHVREPALRFVREMAPRLAELTPALVADDRRAGGSLMRIHRDTRFSPDKTPYKTNVGIQFRHRVGKDVHAPGLYLHLDLDGAFVGVGVYRPEPAALQKIREAIAERPDDWRAIIDSPPIAQGRWRQHDEALKRPPKGFSPDHPLIDEIKRKSYIVVTDLDPELIEDPALCDTIAAQLAAVRAYPAFICRALGLEL